MIADLEKITSNYLRTHPTVTPLGTRLVGKTPTQDSGGTTGSWVRVTQLDARDQTRGAPDHLIAYLLQFDCYAGSTGGQPEATSLARTVRAALAAMPGTRDTVVVTSVRFTGHIRLPDTDFSPSRERVVLTAEIRAHT